MIQNHINQTRQIDPDSKYLLLKHHHWLNMTKLGLEQVRIRKFTFVILSLIKYLITNSKIPD